MEDTSYLEYSSLLWFPPFLLFLFSPFLQLVSPFEFPPTFSLFTVSVALFSLSYFLDDLLLFACFTVSFSISYFVSPAFSLLRFSYFLPTFSFFSFFEVLGTPYRKG